MDQKKIAADQDDKPPSVDQAQTRSFFVDSNPQPFFPYYYENHLSPDQQELYRYNGQSKLIKQIQLKVVTDLEDCQQLWQEFSPQKTIFDTWSFRYAFWLGYRHRLHFVVLTAGSENLALLPLWYETDKQKYFWFGSWWQEENSLMVKDELLIPLLLAVCPTPVELNALHSQLPAWFLKTAPLQADDPKYILDLKNLTSADDFLARFNKKKRYNFRRDRRLINAKSPKVFFNRYEDFDHLVELSKNRFAQKGEDTDWEDERRVETFRQVIKLGLEKKEYDLRMISIEIDSRLAAVDLITMYKDCYYPLKCGYDVGRFPGIGNFTNLFEIDDAISLGMNKMDFLEIGYGWKDKWFEPISLFKYTKK